MYGMQFQQPNYSSDDLVVVPEHPGEELMSPMAFEGIDAAEETLRYLRSSIIRSLHSLLENIPLNLFKVEDLEG